MARTVRTTISIPKQIKAGMERIEGFNWSAIASEVFAAATCNLSNTAGFAVGVGEWRPEKSGNHGLFHVQ